MKPRSLTLGDFFLIHHVSLTPLLEFVQLYCIGNPELIWPETYKTTEVCKKATKLRIIYTLSFLLEYTASSKDIMVFQSTSEFRSANLCYRRLKRTVPILYLCIENISPNKYVTREIYFAMFPITCCWTKPQQQA